MVLREVGSGAVSSAGERRKIKDRLVDQFFAARQRAERRKDDGKESATTTEGLAATLSALAKQLPQARQ